MKNVLLHSTAALATVAALSAPLYAANSPVIHEVSVTTDYSDLTDANAKDFYPTITDDLMTAIADRIELSDDPTGYSIDVTILNVSLDGDTVLPENKEFNTMDGVINVSAPNAKGISDAIPVELRATTPSGVIPEGNSAAAPSEGEFYQAMIEGYADAVVENLPEIPTGTPSR